MLLNDKQITSWADTGGMTPFNRANLNPNSIDITMGDEIALEGGAGFFPHSIADYSEAEPFELGAGEIALIKVREWIDLSLAIVIGEYSYGGTLRPMYLTARAVGKSGRAREGLDLLNAGFAEAGYKGNLTLAVKNQRTRGPQKLWPGKRFAQLLLTPCLQPSAFYDGHYQGDSNVQPSKGYFHTNHQS